MKLSLLFTLVILAFIALDTVEGGILRRTRRLRRVGISRHGRPRSHRLMPQQRRNRWPHFLAPPRKYTHGRSLHRLKTNSEREDRLMHRPVHQMRLPLMMAQAQPLHAYQAQASTQLNSWRPLDFGSPVDRDPTFDYAPPSLERVRFSDRPISGKRNRNNNNNKQTPKIMSRENGKPRPPLFKPPHRRPSIWKLLATKQRRRPFPKQQQRPMMPPFMRFPENSPAGLGHGGKDEAEIFPRIPNIVYFQHQDVLKNAHNNRLHGGPPPSHSPHHPNGGPLFLIPGGKPGKVTNVPLYSRENVSPSQFNPVSPQSTTPMSITPNIPKRPDDILYRPQDFMNPVRKPTILQPVPVYSSTPVPVTVQATRNSVMKPIDPTESLLDIINDPPRPIKNSVSILDSVNSLFGGKNEFNPLEILAGDATDDEENVQVPQEEQEEEQEEQQQQQQPPSSTPHNFHNHHQQQPIISHHPKAKDTTDEESSTVSVSTSVSSSTSVLVRGTEVSTSSTTTESSVSSSSSPSSSSAATAVLYQKLPEIPTYKKRQPIYPKRFTPIKSSAERNTPVVASSSSSSSNKDPNNSGEGLVITMARSKVKEYKPQFLANYTQLLTFDKVVAADAEDNDSTESSTAPSLTVTSAPVPSTSTTTLPPPREAVKEKSPMQDFDPMQLLHNWFQNT